MIESAWSRARVISAAPILYSLSLKGEIRWLATCLMTMASKTDYKAVDRRTDSDKIVASDSGRAGFVVYCSLLFRNDSHILARSISRKVRPLGNGTSLC